MIWRSAIERWIIMWTINTWRMIIIIRIKWRRRWTIIWR
jgi:hypothetical protein